MVTDLNAQRGIVDTGLLALVGTMGQWLDLIAVPAQQLAMWVTILVALGRGVLFALDVLARVRGARSTKQQ